MTGAVVAYPCGLVWVSDTCARRFRLFCSTSRVKVGEIILTVITERASERASDRAIERSSDLAIERRKRIIPGANNT